MLSGYDTASTALFEVSADKITDFDIALNKTSDKPKDGEITIIKKVVVRSTSALGREDNGAPPIGSSQLVKGASRSPGGIIAGTVAGVNADAGGNLSFVGSRTDGTAIIVDGVRVRSGSNVNTQSLGQVNVIVGGVPSQYGDFTGGAVSYTTKGISSRHSKSIEVLSSSPFNPYHNNTLEFFANGPLYIKNKGADANDTTIGPERTVLGYLFNISGNFTKDADPSYLGYSLVKEDKLAEIQKNPLVNGHAGSIQTIGSYIETKGMTVGDTEIYGGVFNCDLDYPELLEIPLLNGRYFDEKYAIDIPQLSPCRYLQLEFLSGPALAEQKYSQLGVHRCGI